MSALPTSFDEAFTRSDMGDDQLPENDHEGFEDEDTELAEMLVEDAMGSEGDEPTDERRQPLTEDELEALCQREIESALGGGDYESELSTNRIAAYRYYDGNMKRAAAGRSNAVSTDVADVIEWTMPQVMDALLNTENVVEFDATSEEDEDQAQLETDACEHVMLRENNGFLRLQACIRDALLLKNGVMKVYWEAKQDVEQASYEGLTEQELQMLLEPAEGKTIEPVAHEQRQIPGPPGPDGQPQPQMVFDVDVSIRSEGGRIVTKPVPPDEWLISREHDAIELDDVRFCGHSRLITRSTLVEEGFDYNTVYDLPGWTDAQDGERQERRRYEDEEGYGSEPADESMQLVRHIECYIRVDADRDGVAELLKVDMAGDSGAFTMLKAEPVDVVPFVGCTGVMVQHKFFGKSLFDRVWEIQDQKTRVLRSLQDNLEHQNNARNAVVVGQVNLDDMLTNRPGGIVRVKSQGAIAPLTAPQIGEWGYRHLDWLDSVRTGRAGVSPDTANVSDAIGGDTAHGLERIMSAKEELTGLIIKMIANTLTLGTMRLVRMNLQKHRTTAMHFKKRGQWQQVNPQEWKERVGATVLPGLSQGDKARKASAYGTLIEQQARAVEMGGMGTMVSEVNIHNALVAFARATPIGDPSSFWTDPASEEAQQARQQAEEKEEKAAEEARNAQKMILQTQLDIESAKDATKRMEAVLKTQEAEADRMAKLEETIEKLAAQYVELELKYATDVPGKGMYENGEGGPAGDADDNAPILPPEWGGL